MKKKSEAHREVEKIQIYVKLQSIHHAPLLKCLLESLNGI